MKEKIEKENIIKTKSEKGAITLFVLLACLFFVFTLTGVYISNVNRLKSQEQDIKQIQENYKRELDNIDEIYEEISSDGVTVTLTKEPEEWTKTVTLKGTGEVKEGKNIEIVEYAFTKDKDVPVSSDWKSAEESEKTKIEKTEEVTENGKYIFWVKDTEGNIYKSNEIEVKNIDKTLPTPGSIIAKKDNVDGEEYVFEKWTDTDVYVEKVDGTDGESGHKSTTITVQKNGITMSEYTNVEGPITLTENGTYTITVTTEDNTGNKATSEPYIVKIDKVIPVLALKHNDVNGADYEQGTWTKDDLYGEITIDTSNSGKTVEKYQYSYNGITWNDVSEETAPTSLDYTTTFPMGEDKPEWISGPTNNGTYYFDVQEDGTLKPNNSGVNSKTANSYFELDLTEYPDAELEIIINATISSENNYDYGYATITTSATAPAYNSSTGRFIYVSGSTKTADYTTTLTGGQKYYLHIGYRKDGSGNTNQDTFIINSITLKSDALGKSINFYNYTKQDNKVSFTLEDNIDEEIYIRAVYNSTENDTSRYTGKQSIKIDKKAPVIESTEPVITSKTDAKMNVNVVEDGSGLKGYYISTEDVSPTEQSTWTEAILKEFAIEGLKTETTYYLWTIDNVGNISSRQEIVIGTANYTIDGKTSTETLAEAITVATDGSTIQLLNDYTDTSTATFSKNITFDVQSYTLTRKTSISISSRKNVEITGTGKITTESNNVRTITNSGILTLSNSITIENTSTSSTYAPIYTNSSSSITNINDNVKIIGYYKGIYNYSGTVNVNGGYIEATYQNNSAYGIYIYNNSSKVYIKNGEIRGYYGIYNYSDEALLEVNGGKIVGTGAYGIYVKGTTNIYGGRIEGKTYGLYSNVSDKITLGRQEDELSTTIPAIYGEIYGIYMSDKTYRFNFYNGKIISNTKETACRGQANLRTGHMPYTYFDYDIEQRYCTILTPMVENIEMEATPTEFTNKNVTVKITYPYNTDTKQYSEDGKEWINTNLYNEEIILNDNKTIYARTITETGTITDENQIVINNIDKEKPTVTVTPTQTNYVVTETNGTIDLNITITAQDTGVSGLNIMQYAWTKEGEEPKYIDFNNTITIDKTKLVIGQYNLYLNVTDKAGNKADLVQMRYNVKYQEPVAQIANTKYLTIQEAVEACSKSAGEIQTTITMLKSTDEEFNTYEGQNIILDLKGYTIGNSSIETPICTNNGILQIVDTSTNKIGKLESLNGTAIQNNGELIIGDSNTGIENDTPTIYGYKTGIENNNIFNFYDGKIQGITPIKGNVTDTPAEYGPVSTGYNDGITTVQLGIVSGYEARIEWVYYTAVQEAVNDVKMYKTDKEKDIVTILKDVQLQEVLQINISKKFILDLNGYILSINPNINQLIENRGDLTIIDSSNDYSGTITSTSKTIINYDTADLTINGGKIITTAEYSIYNSGECTINDGIIQNENYSIYNYEDGKAYINGGKISSSGAYRGYCIYNKDNGLVEISGGNMYVESSGYRTIYCIYNKDNGIIKTFGGTIEAYLTTNNSGTAYGIFNENDNTMEIESTNIVVTTVGSYSDGYGIYNNGSASIEIKKDTTVTVEANSSSIGIYNNLGNILIDNSYINIKDGTSFGVEESCGLFNKNGNVDINSSEINGYASGIYNEGEGKIVIKSGIVTGGLSFNNVISDNICGIYNKTTGNLEILDSNIHGSYTGIINADTGSVKVLSGTIEGKSYGINNYNTGKIIIGEEKTINIDNLKIKSEKIGINNVKGELYFYNGMLQGSNNNAAKNITKIQNNYDIYIETIDEGEQIYLVPEIKNKFVAQIEETKYYTIQDALNSIDDKDEKTIKIIEDVTISQTVYCDKNVTIDLNGKTIQSYYSIPIINEGKIILIDQTANKTGKINTAGISLKNINEGNLNINDITINSNDLGIFNTNQGFLKITNANINASTGIINDMNGKIEIVSGNIIVTEQVLSNENNGQITISDGIFRVTEVNKSVIANVDEGTITLNGGIVENNNSQNSSNVIGINNASTGTIIVTGGEIIAKGTGYYTNSKGINNVNGQIIFSNGKIEAYSNAKYSGKYNSYGIYNQNGSVNVTGGTIISTSATRNGYGIYNYDVGNITIGIKDDGIVDDEYPNIVGKYTGTDTNYFGYGIYNTKGNFYFYDGKIEGTTKAVYDNITEIQEGATVNYNENETILTLSQEALSVAEVSGTQYTTLQAAIDAITTEQATIKLLRSIVYSQYDSTQIVPTGKNIILDLNGYTINSNIPEEVIINNGILEIIDSSIDKSGKIISIADISITNNYNATLSLNIYIENRKKIAVYNEGTLNIKGGTIYTTSTTEAYCLYNVNGQMTIDGGTIISDVTEDEISYGIYNDSIYNIKISNASITSKSEGNRHHSCGIYNNKESNIDILSTYIYSYTNGIQNLSTGKITIADTIIIAGDYGIYNLAMGIIEFKSGKIGTFTYGKDVCAIYNTTGTVTIGIKDGNILTEADVCIGGIFTYNQRETVGNSKGIYNGSGNLYIYDGGIYGKLKIITGNIEEIEDESELIKDGNFLKVQSLNGNIASIGSIEYDSIQKAIEASDKNETIIKILRNTNPGATINIAENQDIILDLNGYTISNYTELINNGSLKIIDTSSTTEGGIIGISEIAITNLGIIELNSGAISDSTYGIKNTGTLNITGGKIENNTYGIYNGANGNTTIANGEITSNTYGIYNYASTSTTNINGGTISANEYGIYNYNGTTNINNIEMLNNTYGIYNAGGTTNVNSTTVTGTTYGIYNSEGTTNIKEVSQVQSQTGIYVANGTVNIGEQGTMNPDSPIITGENFGLEVSATGVVYMYDGQIKGKQGATQGFITHAETGYAVANKVDGEYFVDYLALAGTISTVAEVNGVSYSNLQSAINSVVGEEPQTVKLTNGIISTMTFNIEEGQNIILDMNGKTISSDLDVTINNAGTLVIIDSASSGVAKISSTTGTAINNTGTLILGQDDGTVSQDLITIEGQTYGITTSGTLSFYDGTINGASAVNGTVTNRPSGYVIRTTTVNGKERYYLSL